MNRKKEEFRAGRPLDLVRPQLASSETARDINRDIVLELIRELQPVSRAELSRASGLQRSTISSITEQLISEKWVKEGAVVRLPRGRRPTLLELNDEFAAIALDIHPTQAAVAIIDIKGRILSRVQLPVVLDPAKTILRLADQIKAMIQKFPEKSFEGIGVSLPGRIDPETQEIIFAPNLKWRGVQLKETLEKTTGLSVELDNAANACLRSERWFGRMKGVRNAVLVTVSEGIGTGILADGRFIIGQNGMAGEFGHIPIDPTGPRCACNSSGCWETFGSCQAALRYFEELAQQPRPNTFLDLIHLAENGDAAAITALKKQAQYIGRGLRIITAALSPEVILIAGDVTSAWHFFAEAIEAELVSAVLVGKPPQLIPADEGDTACLRGAGALILQRRTGENKPVSVAVRNSA